MVGATPEHMLAQGFQAKISLCFFIPKPKKNMHFRTEVRSGISRISILYWYRLEDDLIRRDLTINAIAMTAKYTIHMVGKAT